MTVDPCIERIRQVFGEVEILDEEEGVAMRTEASIEVREAQNRLLEALDRLRQMTDDLIHDVPMWERGNAGLRAPNLAPRDLELAYTAAAEGWLDLKDEYMGRG
jgi:hypothetical protein